MTITLSETKAEYNRRLNRHYQDYGMDIRPYEIKMLWKASNSFLRLQRRWENIEREKKTCLMGEYLETI